MKIRMRQSSIGRGLARGAALLAALGVAAGCEMTEPEPRLRFSPASVTLRVGDSREIVGILPQGTLIGDWFVQPNQISEASVEVTGAIEARITCVGQGSGAFVFSALTTAGQFNGPFYFVCSP